MIQLIMISMICGDRFEFYVNSKSDIKFVNGYKWAEPIFRFCPCLYYTEIFRAVNAAP